MEKIEEKLKEAWNRINYYKGGSLLINVDHKLEWHVAYETEKNKALVIISNYKMKNIESSKSIKAVCTCRDDGKYYISFQLTDKAQEDVFITMCGNLIEYSSNATDEIDAVHKVEKRFAQWRRLMEKKNEGILSSEKRKGLIGELLFLNEVIDSGKELFSALRGWVGPDGADQDFVYDGVWDEIKATGIASDKIEISSIEQLGTDNDKGILRIYRIDECAPEMKGAITLRSIVKQTVNKMNGNPDCIDLFTSKLNEVGYIDIEEYEKYPYKTAGNSNYNVDESFPRVTRGGIRAEIVKCSYYISIPSIDCWKRG